jgi:hypothetical protein
VNPNAASFEADPTRRPPPTTSTVQRPRRFWTRALPGLVRHIFTTMPWGTLLAGCASGTIVLALMAHFAGHSPLDQNTVRLTLLPAVGALAFVPHVHFRPLIQSTPVPIWVASVAQMLLAVPILAITCAVQLDLMASTFPAPYRTRLPAVYPLIAQFTAWSLLAVSIAAGCERTRYTALSGAISAPVTFTAIAAAWFIPPLHRHLLSPPDTAMAATIAWYTIAVAALTVAIVATRDQWHRYTRRPHPSI